MPEHNPVPINFYWLCHLNRYVLDIWYATICNRI